MINVLADQYLYKIKSYLPNKINLSFFNPEAGLPKNLTGTQGLLIRTVTPINKQTLPDIPSQLSFVGTGSAGTDHIDVDYLTKNGVAFASSPGCNAQSVAEYIGTALLIWAERRNHNIANFTIGILGIGHVGTQVIELLDRLEISTVAYDPPREKREANFTSASIDQLLDCDILSFHTPLTTETNYPTYHWLDDETLSERQFELIINAARGGVVDEAALLRAMEKDTIKDIIIDVWDNEPDFNLKTAEQAFIKTPHIAGYAVQSKENASRLVANALLDHFEITRPKNQNQSNPRIVDRNISAFQSLSQLLTELHPIKKYESELDNIIRDHPDERGKFFNKLRVELPFRQDFEHTCLPASYFEKYPVLKDLGFSMSNH